MAKKKPVKKAEKPKENEIPLEDLTPEGDIIEDEEPTKEEYDKAVKESVKTTTRTDALKTEPEPEPGPKLHKLKIITEPKGAAVFINGEDQHIITPHVFELPESIPGIVLQKEGYVSFPFQVKLDHYTQINVHLVPLAEGIVTTSSVIEYIDRAIVENRNTSLQIHQESQAVLDKIKTQLTSIMEKPNLQGPSTVKEGYVELTCGACASREYRNVVNGLFTCDVCGEVRTARE